MSGDFETLEINQEYWWYEKQVIKRFLEFKKETFLFDLYFEWKEIQKRI